MSAVIIQFIPRPRHDHEQTDFPTIVFRSAVHESPTDRTDIALSEYVAPDISEMW